MLQVPSLLCQGPVCKARVLFPSAAAQEKRALGICEQPPRDPPQRPTGRRGVKGVGGGGAVWMQRKNVQSGNPQGNWESQKRTPHFHRPVQPRASQHSMLPGRSRLPDPILHTPGARREEGGREKLQFHLQTS